MPLTGRIALVSGAARGIGRAIALRLAREGADVGLIDLNPAVEETARLVRDLGRRAAPACADISRAAEARAAVARIAAELGAIDLLVNNAGVVNNIATVEKMTDEAWENEVGVNLTGAFNLVRATVGAMAERGFGRIVNISSVAARGGDGGDASAPFRRAGGNRRAGRISLQRGGRLHHRRRDRHFRRRAPQYARTGQPQGRRRKIGERHRAKRRHPSSRPSAGMDGSAAALLATTIRIESCTPAKAFPA